MNQNDFSNISISDELKQGIADMGYSSATSIQSQSIPIILEGRDVIGKSQTGSGKTAAFGLPALDRIDTSISPKIVQVLILCPTRELAMQACTEIRKFSKYKEEIHVVPIFGGDSIDRQIMQLRQGCQIVVGTPGRIMDHMNRKTLKFSEVKMVVLDEADEMLNMGFIEDIELILTGTPEERQTILFSATMPKAVLDITKKFQKDPVTVEIKEPQLTVSTIEQFYFRIPKAKKKDALLCLLDYYKPERSIVFCNTKKMVDELIEELNRRGYPAQGLHGDMRQASRTQVMNQFKDGKIAILAATDVAARGIDVNDIKVVFNYDLPQDDEYYVHRIGRTGRAGKSGQAFTLVQGPKQFSQLKNIMNYTKCEILERELPSFSEINNRNTSQLVDEISAFMAQHEYKKYMPAIEKMVDEKNTAIEIAAALFAMSVKQNTLADETTADFASADWGRESDEKSKQFKKHGGIGGRKFKNDAKYEYNDENMTSIKISIGKKDKVMPNQI